MPKRKNASTTSSAASRRRATTSYVLYETFADPKIPIDDVAQGMARAVAYDEDATQQVLALLAKCAGLKGTPEIAVKQPKQTAQDLELLCEGAPAAYPLAAAKQMHRFEQLMALFYPVLHDSQSDDALLALVPFLAALSGVHLRSLRHAATAVAAPVYDATMQLKGRISREVTQLRAQLLDLLSKRALDVGPEIRALAVSAIQFFEPALNDENPQVRLAVLGATGASEATGDAAARIQEIATSDVDPRCREAAVALLEDTTAFLTDSEPLVAAAAATKFLESHSLEEVPLEVSSAGAVALARAANLSIEDATQQAIAQESLVLLVGACTATANAESRAAEVVASISQLLDHFSHKDKVLAESLTLFRFVDLEAALARDLEQDITRLVQDAAKVYLEHPSSEIQQAFPHLVKPLIENSAFAHPIRTQLGEILEQLVLSSANLTARTGQVAPLGRYIDVSDFASPQVYAQDTPETRKFARNVAFHGSVDAISEAIEYLGSLPDSADDLLQVLVVARVRSLNVDFDTDKLTLEGVEKRTLEAARAAEIIA